MQTHQSENEGMIWRMRLGWRLIVMPLRMRLKSNVRSALRGRPSSRVTA